MQPPPSLPSPDWPDPNADGTTTLSVAQMRALLLVLSTIESYLSEQYAACGESVDGTVTAPAVP